MPGLRSCPDSLPEGLAHEEGQVRRVTVRLKGLVEGDRHHEAVAVMTSVPEVGVITATSFRLELPEQERFDHEGRVARMACLAPTGPSEREDPPRGRAAEVGQRTVAYGAGGGGLEMGRLR
jgi:hypothetical protein